MENVRLQEETPRLTVVIWHEISGEYKLNKQAELVEYYFKYRELVELHRRLKFGDAPRTSEGFTESICRELFGFVEVKGIKREYDLRCPKNDWKIEVKATVDHGGATTINPKSKFDFLYWLTFRLDYNCLWVKIYSYEVVQSMVPIEKKKAKRLNISLGQLEKNEGQIQLFKFDKDTKTIKNQSLKEHLEEIKCIK